jgi:uroporphyrin-III C-methyltransferase / precorrin-2 dehydrogenase / sirohydrochlorin ferrochelatase
MVAIFTTMSDHTMVTVTPLNNEFARMQPLARLPIFLALEGKRAVVSGGTAGAAWKTELLSAAGAEVHVYAPATSKELLDVAARPPCGPVTIHHRELRAADFAGAALAIAACEDDALAAQVATMARAAGVPVNVIDRPAFCDFSFGAIVNRSPLVIGISTDGAAPVFAQMIRAKLEALIPLGFARWAEAARRWRPRLQALGLNLFDRRRFWETFVREAAAHPDRAPTPKDLDACLTQARGDGARGALAFVGVELDDPEMLTLRAVRALHSADVIMFDASVPAPVLEFARREARKLMIGQSPEEIDALTIRLARQGKRVVRLVSAAASASARQAIASFQRGGIPIDVVSGIGWMTENEAAADRVRTAKIRHRAEDLKSADTSLH